MATVLGLMALMVWLQLRTPASGMVPDTPEGRLAAARRYVKMVPSKLAVESIIHELSAQREVAQRDAFQRLLKRELRVHVIDEATIQSLTRHFTASEINTLTAFNSSPEGLSIQKKMGDYMAEALPPLSQEIARVLTMTNAALAQLQWKTRLLEGTAPVESENMTAEFNFVNRGTRPVSILALTSSCGCVAAMTSRTNYPPNFGGAVKVTFDFGPRVGAQSKYATVRTDDPCEPEVRLQMDVQIPEVIKIEPPFAYWPIGVTPTASVHRISVLQPDCTVVGLVASNPVFCAQLTTNTPNRSYEVRVTPTTCARRAVERLELLVAVSPTVTRRFPLFVAVDATKLAR